MGSLQPQPSPAGLGCCNYVLGGFFQLFGLQHNPLEVAHQFCWKHRVSQLQWGRWLRVTLRQSGLGIWLFQLVQQGKPLFLGPQGLSNYDGFCAPRWQDHVWSEWGHCHVLWEYKLPLLVHTQLPVRGVLQGKRKVLGCHASFTSLISFPHRGYGFGRLAATNSFTIYKTLDK